MLLGIDGTAWVHQLWHAHGGRGVVPVLTRRTEALVSALSPSAVVACFDRRSFRHGLAPGYKAGRPDRDPQLDQDLAAAETAIADLATIAAEDGYEADDGLATLAYWARLAGQECVLASPDKDLRQCLAGPVELLRSFALRGGELVRVEWYTAMSLYDEYGLEPAQWIDYQMLVGDRGDAIAGCKGWGEKTAAAALAKCRTLEAMFHNPWSVPCTDRQRGALITWRKDAPLARQLVTLRTDCAAVWDAMR